MSTLPTLVEGTESLVDGVGLLAEDLLVRAKVVAPANPAPRGLPDARRSTLPLSRRDPSVQMVSQRLHVGTVWSASALSSTMVRAGKRRQAPRSWASTVSLGRRVAAALRRAVSVDWYGV